MAQATITVSLGASSTYPSSNDQTSNTDEIYELRTRSFSVDVDGTDYSVVKRDGGLYVVREVFNGSPVVVNLPDPGEGYEIRYTVGANRNPSHTSSLYSSALTFTQNSNSSDNTVLKMRVYSTTNHTIRGDVLRIEFNVT